MMLLKIEGFDRGELPPALRIKSLLIRWQCDQREPRPRTVNGQRNAGGRTEGRNFCILHG
jgi:hypothetical protein